MPTTRRDRIFLSYSRGEKEIFDEVKSKLLARPGLRGRLWDDSAIAPGTEWDTEIQDAMDATAVAVLILSDHYFSWREKEGSYILERELPYFLEHRRRGDLDILLLYWRPSNHYAPDIRDNPGLVQPFEYQWDGEQRSFPLQDIQDANRGAALSGADERRRLDALLQLAKAAEDLLARRLEEQHRVTDTVPQGHTLTIDLAIAGPAVSRVFKAGGETIPVDVPRVPKTLLAKLQASTGPIAAGDREGLGADLYQLLFGPEQHDRFPRIAEVAWDVTPAPQANTLAATIEVRCDAIPDAPWPLDLPWNLAAFRGEGLAEQCKWAFETVPPGLDTRRPQVLDAEPPLLLLYDAAAPWARGHLDHIRQFIDDTYGFAADLTPCEAVDELADRLARAPRPEVLYVYAKADLDLSGLAGTLAGAVPLVVLNLLGEAPPRPPAALVEGRKVVIALHGLAQADAARQAAHKWLRSFLAGAGHVPWQRPALEAFGPATRLWSGCGTLATSAARPGRTLFRRNLIRLLLDRVAARREVSDEVAQSLSGGLGVLGLVAAGTAADQPHLLPRQVWHHYREVREAGSRDLIRRKELQAGDYPAADELHYRLADQLGVATRAWEDALDDDLGEIEPGERAVVSLEWRVPACPADTAAEDWRRHWLDAWLALGTDTLVQYRRPGVLIVHMLLAETAAPDEARAWCDQARERYRERRRTLSETGRRFVYHHLAPLSQVPEEDIERFFGDAHYRLQAKYPDLDPYAVACWVHERTGGDFAGTVAFVEDLHDTGFQAALKARAEGEL